MTELRLRRLAALCAALTVAGACTSNDDNDGEAAAPPPPSATEDNDGGGEDPASLDEATAVGQYVALQHAIIQLAPIDPGDIDVEGAGDGIVVDGSPAAEFLTDRLTTMVETGTGPSGEVVDADVLDLRESGEQVAAVLCVLQETEPVDLATGDIAQGAPEQANARYLQIEATYTHIDGDWLIDGLPGLESDGRPADCVPPSIAQAVRANWEAHEQAVADWIDASFSVETRAPLEPLVTEARWEEIEATEPEEPTGRVQGDIAYDLELLSATRTEVVGEWCLDGSRDPDATTLRNGELVDNDTRSLVRGRWRLEGGEWRVAEHDESRGDVHILAGTVDAPEGHRCL
jgi:hypothetical protein